MPRAKLADYEIQSLRPFDLQELSEFTCGDADLDDFVRNDALGMQEAHLVATYLARGRVAGNNIAVVGYVALLNDAIILQGAERKKLGVDTSHPVVPAIKVARLAVTARHQRAGGIGTTLVAYAYYVGLTVAETTGCRLLTVDAYPESVAFYERLGFVRNKAKEYRERTLPSLRLDLFGATRPSWI